ncbi:MAG TPA: cellulose biosynthesis cyclic di-GMP-binding regulatory protein BcsB [Succinivibrionaceae bacterium]|nr:cellulose biosynthesis cyclic di-GMP-binding regulatory protein BcsB [Succinivibrionaceae bacterium]
MNKNKKKILVSLALAMYSVCGAFAAENLPGQSAPAAQSSGSGEPQAILDLLNGQAPAPAVSQPVNTIDAFNPINPQMLKAGNELSQQNQLASGQPVQVSSFNGSAMGQSMAVTDDVAENLRPGVAFMNAMNYDAAAPYSVELTFADLGAKHGVILSPGQLETGLDFTLPVDKIVSAAKLILNVGITEDVARRSSHLDLLLNGQPIGTVPLNNSTGIARFELDLPFEYFTTANSFGFKLADDPEYGCLIDYTNRYKITIKPDSILMLEGRQLKVDADLNIFPLPYLDPYEQTKRTVEVVLGAKPRPQDINASSLLASWMGISADYRGVKFHVSKDELPEAHCIVIGRPGENIGGITMPEGPSVSIIANPINPFFNVLLISSDEYDGYRNAIYMLTNGKFGSNTRSFIAESQKIVGRESYDAPKWIATDRKVYLSELLRNDQSLSVQGIWHNPISINFRAAPDLYQLYGFPADLYVEYNFPLEQWMDENNSWLNITLSGNYIDNLPVNKVGLLENLWRFAGGDGRQESRLIALQPYMIYGDNSLNLYFDIKLKSNAPCSILQENNIRSIIGANSYIDLSNTVHYAEMPNLSFFVGASFPFTKYADYSETVSLLSENPSNSEIQTLLGMAARAGNATGIPLYYNSVVMGIKNMQTAPQEIWNKNILAVSTLKNRKFMEELVENTPFEFSGSVFSIKDMGPLSFEGGFFASLGRFLTGQWHVENLDANRYLHSNTFWRGFLSFISPWNSGRIAVVVTATDDQQLDLLIDDLDRPAINNKVAGDVTLISGVDNIRSFRVGDTIFTGNVSMLFNLLHFAGSHEIWLGVIFLILFFIFSMIISSWLKKRAVRRLNEGDDKE